MFAIVFYLALKISLYIGVCYLAPKFFLINPKDRISFAIKYGIIRLIIGFAAGFFIINFLFWVGHFVSNPLVAYLISFGSARYVEWFLVAIIIHKQFGTKNSVKSQQWILVGVLSSITIDGVVMLLGNLGWLGNLKFFC